MACHVCKNQCNRSIITGTRFFVHFQDCHRESLMVPCKARLEFNELVPVRVVFRALRSLYNFRVEKGRTKTTLYGSQWIKFITDNNLSIGDMLVFSMKPSPRISVALVYTGSNRSSEEDQESSSDDEIMSSSQEDDHDRSEDDEIDDDDKIIVAQRANLTPNEKNRLAELLPVGPYVGLLFVTRFTRTNLRRHDMKLPSQIAENAGIPPHGNAGLRFGASGEAATTVYNKRADGRLDLDTPGWKNFIQGYNVWAGDPVLIILRKTSDPTLDVMIEMLLI